VALDLVRDEARATRIGEAARERVRDRFLGSRTFEQYLHLFESLLAAAG
jgi:hypothetical protein